MTKDRPVCTLGPLQDSFSKTEPEQSTYHQWPWRGLAFCSDLGTVGYLINQPKLGLFGWGLAMPYYLTALLKQPKGPQRQQEFVYQITANGLFPLLEAKAGITVGEFFAQRLKPGLPPSLLKLTGGILALLTLTPTLGDPLSRWVLKQYQATIRKGQTL